ncbi:MAG: GhoT/OrtT family toxin [Escherichia coli]|nr:GhoT/OrtT family toxin [Escherichia coli]
MSLYQHMLVFYAVMAAIAFLITWFLSHDKKRIRFLSAFLVGATWPMSFRERHCPYERIINRPER